MVKTVNEKLAEQFQNATPQLIKIEAVKLYEAEEIPNKQQTAPMVPSAYGYGYGGGSVYSNTGYVPITFGVFNGEKSPGSLGLPMDLRVDARALRFRAYEAVTTSDIITIITGKFFKWVVGVGMKMQSQPNKKILALEKVTEDFKAFVSNVEEYFAQYAESPRSDYAGMDNLHLNASKAFETAFLGGDCLVVLRVNEKNNISSQVIDGQHVGNPVSADASVTAALKASGNILVNGIEVDKKGKHIAFWARKQQSDYYGGANDYSYERIEAYGKESGCLMAWMVYGKKNRIDHHRGISMLSAILEKVTKLDRYTEATVSTAEERAKLVWTVVHGKTSTGEDPLITGLKMNTGAAIIDGAGSFLQGAIAAQQIALTEQRKVYNLPVDSELKTVSSQQEIDYNPFWTAVFDQLCAAMEIPPEVALQKYNSNYSASRAAINGWEYIVKIYRKRFADKYYKPFYDLWLYIHVLKGKISAAKYLDAKTSGNDEIVEAYSAAKFTGVNMPMIDPKKEADAMRIMLGLGDQSPLITHEDAAEKLGNGDWEANMAKIEDENEILTDQGYMPIPLPPAVPEDNATKI